MNDILVVLNYWIVALCISCFSYACALFPIYVHMFFDEISTNM